MVEWTYTQIDVNSVATDDLGNSYLGGDNGVLHKVDSTGSQVWTVTTPGSSISSVKINTTQNEVYVASSDTANVYDTDGTPILNETATTTVSGMDGGPNTIVWTHGNYISAYERSSGTVSESQEFFNGSDSLSVGPSPTTGSDYAYIGNSALLNQYNVPALSRNDFIDYFESTIPASTFANGHLYAVGTPTGQSEGLIKIDDALNDVWTYTNSEMTLADGISYDSLGNTVYTSTGAPFEARQEVWRIADEGGAIGRTFNDSRGGVDVSVHDDGSYVLAQDSDGASEFTELTQTFFDATQVSVIGTMNTAEAQNLQLATATQPSAFATMNLGVDAQDITVSATQVSGLGTMNSVSTLDITYATPISATASANQLLTEDLKQPVEIVAGDGTVFNATGIRLDDGRPEFVRGSTITRVLFFDDSGSKLFFQNKTPQETYTELRDDYGRYLSEKTIKYGVSHEGLPYFWQNTNPRSPVPSYLWELRPRSVGGLESWWVLPLSINDVTRMAGPSYALEVELFVIAPSAEGDRTYIKQTYEVDK